MRLVTVISSVMLSSGVSATSNTFLTIGDWGGAALGSYYVNDVNTVATAMARTASEQQSQFVVNTGDSFYWCGIQNATDYQITVDFEEPYSDPSLQVPWYSILGNHEYGYQVEAVLDYAKINPIWVMDDRYYTRRVEIGKTRNYISFIFLDTSPCISAYRSESPSGWDPCGSYYPTCSPNSTDDDYEGECMFHDNIMTQDCSTQYEWFQQAIAAVDDADWLIVVGHHPLDEVDEADFVSVLQSRNFDLYLNGHTHTLVQYTIDGSGAYVTSGAGAMVQVPSAAIQEERMRVKLAGGDWVTPQLNPDPSVSSSSHSYQTVYSEKVAGYHLHSFSDDLQQLTTSFMDYTGSEIYSFTTTKGQGYVA